MQKQTVRVLNMLLVLGMVLAFVGSGAGTVAAPEVEKVEPIAIGAFSWPGEHLVPPRLEVAEAMLRNVGKIPMDASEAEIQAALEDYYFKFAKKSGTWVSPEIQEWALKREAELAQPGLAAQAVQPVTANVFALAIDFGATETFTMPVEQADGSCMTETVTIEGPMQGDMPQPGPLDNNTTWYSPTLTADPTFYENIIFGYKGAGRVRMDLTDPIDGMPGINLEGYTVQDYYDNVAGEGNVTITGTVAGWVTVPHSEGYYGADNCEAGSHQGGTGHYAADMVVDALDIFSATNPSYYTEVGPDAFWPQYDGDGDGILDTLWTIHAGMGQEAGGGAEGTFALWSHSSDIRYYVAPYKVYEGDVMTTTDDIYVGPYTVQPENADLGVFAEEFGHNFFGLPDLYTTDLSNSVGFWNIMSGGAWGGYLGGAQPAGMPLWFRMIAVCGTDAMGDPIPCNWQEPMVTRAYDDVEGTVEIGPLEKTPMGVNKGVRVDLPDVVETVPNYAGDGKGAYTGIDRHDSDIVLEGQVDVPAAASVLSVGAGWDIEANWDYGYVMINGMLVQDMDGVIVDDGDPNGSSAYLGASLTGSGAGTLRFDVAAYAGETITLTFHYKTDPFVNGEGWWIDNVMIDDAVVEDFEDAVAPGTFPGWTNSDDPYGWLVVPLAENYTNYYLVEWRAKTKYDMMVQTAYVTEYYDEDEWQVARVPYNIPGALVYYRNTKYGRSYSMAPNLYHPPAAGPKHQLLIVDMNWEPLTFDVEGESQLHVLNARTGSYDAALTVQDTETFTLTQINTADGPVTGEWVYDTKPAVTTFDDAKGYYFGWSAGNPLCEAGYFCLPTMDSAVIPARDIYPTRLVDGAGNPMTQYYGYTLAGLPLGTGNPGDYNLQHGVNIELVDKTGDDAYGSLATLKFSNMSVDVESDVTPTALEVDLNEQFNVTYQTVVENTGTEVAENVAITYTVDPALTPVGWYQDRGAGTFTIQLPAGTILMPPTLMDPYKAVWTEDDLDPGEVVTLTLVTEGTGMKTTVLSSEVTDGMRAWDLETALTVWRYMYMPFVMRGYTATK